MTEPTRPAPPPAPGAPDRTRYIDFFLYASAAVSYVSLAIYNKWLLDWIVGPFWLVAWVWGLPTIVRLVRHQPVRPRRDPRDEPLSPES